jgi:nitrate reductase assembly molybdenum cofactor insertion protein NarJ
MTDTIATVERGEVALARATLARLCAQAYREPGPDWRAEWDEIAAGAPMALEVLEHGALRGFELEPLWRAAEDLERLRLDHVRRIGHCPRAGITPYETEWTGAAGEILQYHLLADLGGFYGAFGLEPAEGCDERLDHLSLELCFLAYLCVREAHTEEGSEALEIVRAAQRRFLEEHLLAWAPSFCSRVVRDDADGFHAHAARLLQAFLESERARFGLAGECAPRELAESHLSLEDCCVGCDQSAGCAGPAAFAAEGG